MIRSYYAKVTALAKLGSSVAVIFAFAFSMPSSRAGEKTTSRSQQVQQFMQRHRPQTPSDPCLTSLTANILTLNDALVALREIAEMLPEGIEQGIAIEEAAQQELTHSLNPSGQLVIRWPALGLASQKSAFDELSDLILAAPTPSARRSDEILPSPNQFAQEDPTQQSLADAVDNENTQPKKYGSTINVARPGDFVSFEEACKIIAASGIKTNAEYMAQHDLGRFPNLPKKLSDHYKGSYRSFNQMRGFQLVINSRYGWNQMVRLLRSQNVTSMNDYRERRALGEFQELPKALNINYRAYWSPTMSVDLFNPEVDVFAHDEED